VIDGSTVEALGKQAVTIARQVEFPLAVAVCAWCRPKELGAALGSVSHGICPGHLRKLKLQLQGVTFGARPQRRRHPQALGSEPLLFPV
jgi:hypothetical protein